MTSTFSCVDPLETEGKAWSRKLDQLRAHPVNAGGSVTVDSYKEAFERQLSLQPASSISAANILFAVVAIERFAHDGLDRGHFSIRQLGKLALATLAT